MKQMSKKMALCGLLAALATLWLMLGGIFPLAMFCCPILAMMTMIPVVEEYRVRTALAFYAAVALLGLLLSPDKECALVYVFLGCYPVLRGWIQRKYRLRFLRVTAKIAYFLFSAAAVYFIAVYVFTLSDLVTEFRTTGTVLMLLEVALGCAVFLLCDTALARFTALYHQKLRPRLFPKS